MIKIGLLSDTHSHLDDRIIHHLQDVDEIWHAGDIGTAAVSDTLSSIKPYRAVFGNIDGGELRRMHPIETTIEVEGMKFWMTHIGGRPPKYANGIRQQLLLRKPEVFICGHSHILKVQKDHSLDCWYMNPGAAGNHGFHKVRTMMTFIVDQGKMRDLKVIELGTRG
ncbi:MAG: metallophosphoesterase family protein [Flavobacteriales bacterium]|nr:metallophosphoesterase family protein [Flavobacteriales bacterium]